MGNLKYGDIAINEEGHYGMVLSDDDSCFEVIGIHLNNHPKECISRGKKWFSKNPILIGNVMEGIDCLFAKKSLEKLSKESFLTNETTDILTDEITENTNSLGKSLNEIATIAKKIGEAKQFDTPTHLETRENRILMNEKLMLVVTEVAEACQSLRKLDYLNMESELADILIRVFTLCGCLGINIDEKVSEKLKINMERPIKHGKDS